MTIENKELASIFDTVEAVENCLFTIKEHYPYE